MRVVDITPTPAEYRRCLEAIIQGARDESNRTWAEKELKRIMPGGVLVANWSSSVEVRNE